VIDSAAATLGIRAVRTPYRDSAELEHAIATFAAEPNGALLMVAPPPTPINRQLINRLALIHRLPTIYSNKYNVAEGGLMSYGTNIIEAQRRVASYVDRILRDVKINELPVQFPTKFDLVINLRTAKAIGLAIPGTFLALADEVIE
jgi:putative ABC transport system substrate-binding protein